MNPADGWPGDVLERLPALRRQVFLLRVRDGLPLDEVARRTGLVVSQAGALLVLACRAVCPPGRADDPAWLLDARERLRQPGAAGANTRPVASRTPATAAAVAPATAVLAPVPARRGRLAALATLAVVLALVAAASWWLDSAPRTRSSSDVPAAAELPAPPPAVALGPGDSALAAPDLALLAFAQEERALLEEVAFYRWLAEQDDAR